VVDFIDLGIWPVFNIADSCITIGAIGLAIILLRRSN
jgi:lipoprotein signal peptidase